jgi:hypothetical protein
VRALSLSPKNTAPVGNFSHAHTPPPLRLQPEDFAGNSDRFASVSFLFASGRPTGLRPSKHPQTKTSRRSIESRHRPRMLKERLLRRPVAQSTLDSNPLPGHGSSDFFGVPSGVLALRHPSPHTRTFDSIIITKRILLDLLQSPPLYRLAKGGLFRYF